MLVKMGSSSPKRGENKTSLKPPPSIDTQISIFKKRYLEKIQNITTVNFGEVHTVSPLSFGNLDTQNVSRFKGSVSREKSFLVNVLRDFFVDK